MKRKTLISIAALLAGATMLNACTNTSQKIAFSPYWQSNNTTPEVSTQPINETLVYGITFQPLQSTTGYTVAYNNGEYVTTLSQKNTQEGDTVYVYQTSLTIDVTFVYNAQTKTMTDTMTSYMEFATAKNGLTPLLSKKQFICHSPTSDASSLETCYTRFDYSVDVTYHANGTGGNSVVTNREKSENGTSTHNFDIDDGKYSYLDNEQLLFALRGVNPAVSSSPIFLVYDAFKERVQTIKTTFEQKVDAKEFKFHKNEDAEFKTNIAYYPVTISIDSKTPGAAQTVWIAETANPQTNENRNMILRYEAPLSYNLGTLIYELKQATFSN